MFGKAKLLREGGEAQGLGRPTGLQTAHRIGELMRELIQARDAGNEDEVRRIEDEFAWTGTPGSPG